MVSEGEPKTKLTEEDKSYTSILREHNVGQAQREKRIELLRQLAKPEHNSGHKPNGVIAHLSDGALEPDDIPALVNMLLKVGDVDTLNVILHSPGGDGTVVEKFVSLCRVQCKRFRVIIPHQAKSAATLISLGADEIIMGHSSELGPIDAQVLVTSSGVRRYVSAQSFIDARDELLRQYKDLKAKKEDATPVLQMLASLDLPFTAHCESLMAFGRDVAKKLLSEYMLKRRRDKRRQINKIVRELSSVERFRVHGRQIDGNAARREFGLNVRLLGLNDKHWKLIWEYYNRAYIAYRSVGVQKLFESEHEMLVAGGPQTTGG